MLTVSRRLGEMCHLGGRPGWPDTLVRIISDDGDRVCIQIECWVRPSETIVINRKLYPTTIMLSSIRSGGEYRLGFECPKSIRIVRHELLKEDRVDRKRR
jgi:sRNA-binding carbon storage regulator CsrA